MNLLRANQRTNPMGDRLNAEQELAIARVVYPDIKWSLLGNYVQHCAGGHSLYFNPQICGTALEGKQALDTILAASKIGACCYFSRLQLTGWMFIADDDEAENIVLVDDH